MHLLIQTSMESHAVQKGSGMYAQAVVCRNSTA